MASFRLKEIDIEQLLHREPVRLRIGDIKSYITEQTILVTGAGGSIGSAIVEQMAVFGPTSVLMLGRGENSIYQAFRVVRGRFPNLKILPLIADIRDRTKIKYIFEKYRPHVVFHAAAHKHVPLMESNPEEAILNNVVGTTNVAELARQYEVVNFVNVSTDKAVNPSSIMGASKRMAEYVVERVSQAVSKNQEFVSVRFGNVLGSRGSVIPIFEGQIRSGEPVTVTDPQMERYFMTVTEASQLVLQVGALGENGRTYMLDMGEPIRIVDLAYKLIRLFGLEPEVDIPVIFTGRRPGEKLYEELLTAEEGIEPTQHEKIYEARKDKVDSEQLDFVLQSLTRAAKQQDNGEIRRIMASFIPGNMIPQGRPA